MTVRELYRFLDQKIPSALSCSWDNDGLMCCADDTAEVKKVLIALDITQAVINKAVSEGYDLIISHHPMIFSPLKAIDPADHVSRKVITLLRAGISAMSFHTRLDAVEGGVNDIIAQKLGLRDLLPFGQPGEEIGRIGNLPQTMSFSNFALFVKQTLDCEAVQVSDAKKEVSRVAVLGGSGSSDVLAAIAAGADTYVSGELKHNDLTDSPDMKINLIAAGHFETETPVCNKLRDWVLEADASLTVTVMNSNPIRYI